MANSRGSDTLSSGEDKDKRGVGSRIGDGCRLAHTAHTDGRTRSTSATSTLSGGAPGDRSAPTPSRAIRASKRPSPSTRGARRSSRGVAAHSCTSRTTADGGDRPRTEEFQMCPPMICKDDEFRSATVMQYIHRRRGSTSANGRLVDAKYFCLPPCMTFLQPHVEI
jgi:hypothetical protein